MLNAMTCFECAALYREWISKNHEHATCKNAFREALASGTPELVQAARRRMLAANDARQLARVAYLVHMSGPRREEGECEQAG